MYSTCIFCNSGLGSNEILEAFPVGRRIAFDNARGRLWVVCRGCERWNLSPLEERWEAIEQCERNFSATRLRISTENIGLARLAEGLELVRVGKPRRPEMAAWRYGDQFGRRRRKRLITVGLGLGAVGAALAGAGVAGIAIGSTAAFWTQAVGLVIEGNPQTVVARIQTGKRKLPIRRSQLQEIELLSVGNELRLIVPHRREPIEITGDDAQRAIALLMPPINRFGGKVGEVRDAVGLLEYSGDPQAFIRFVAHDAMRRHEFTLREQPFPVRLALEMAAHEDTERRALEGELKALELAWKEAEEIAAISDSLLTSPNILQKIARWRT